MATAITIANMALSQLGAGPISSFDEGTLESSLVAQYYPVMRDAVLEDRNWTFAIHRAVLNPLSKRPAFQYDFAYSLPSGFLRIITVSQVPKNFVRPQNAIYSVEGGKLLAMRAPIYVEYIKRVEQTGLFSAGFIDALATRLAAEMCIAITNSRELAGQLMDMYAFKLATASRNDGMQGSSQRMPPGSLVMKR